MADDNVNVAVRVRPLLPKEKLSGEQRCVKVLKDSNQILVGKDRLFAFDHVITSTEKQETVFNNCVGELVSSCLEGFNATVFAYGQTLFIIFIVPDVASTKSWPVTEINQVILMWYDAEDREPLYMPDELDEIRHEDWVLHAKGEHIVHCHISEIPENGADVGHFMPVHKANITTGSDLEGINRSADTQIKHLWSEASWYTNKTEWHKAHGTLRHDLEILGRLVPIAAADVTFEQTGPAIVQIRQTFFFGTFVVLQFVIPQETFKQRLVHVAIGPAGVYGRIGSIVALRTEGTMVERDIVIWNNKRFSNQSVLASTKSDELLVKFRRWYAQFYSEPDKATKSESDMSW